MNHDEAGFITDSNIQEYGEVVCTALQSYEISEELADIALKTLLLITGLILSLKVSTTLLILDKIFLFHLRVKIWTF